MRFPPDFIEKVRESTNVVELIGQHVELQRSGASLRGLCPFPGHSERTPSFFVSDAKQVYHCFGCGKSGNVFSFLRDFRGMSFPESVEFLAQRASIPLPEPESPQHVERFKKEADEKKTLFKLSKFVAAHFAKNLETKNKESKVWKYIEKRKLSLEVIKEFRIGYAEDSWNELSDYLKKSQAPSQLADQMGLVKTRKDGSYFDILRDRLIFPIMSIHGDVIGFGGRTLGEEQPKYLNSPESPIFHKGRSLYGLYQTAKYIRAQDEAYIVEGYLDLIALYQFGIKNVVATLGTAFTLEHAKLLKRTCSKVVVLFDGDEAGQAAAEKSLPLLMEAGLFSKCLTIPEQQDPDDFLHTYGKDLFLELSQKAPDHFSWYLRKISVGYRGQPADKVRILDRLNPVLAQVRDSRLRTIYMEEVANLLGFERNWLNQNVAAPKPKVVENTVKSENLKPVIKAPLEEILLVQFMLKDPEYLKTVVEQGLVDLFSDVSVRDTARAVAERYCQNPNDFDKLAALLLNEGKPAELLTSHIGSDVRMKGPDLEAGERQLFADCLSRVKDRHLKRKTKELISTLKIDSDSTSETLTAFMEFARQTKGPRGPDKSGM